MIAQYVSESRINATKGYRFSDDTYPVAGTVFEDMETPGEAYRWLQREYGRCTGKVYVDRDGGPPMHVGWVFVKRDKYEDCDETYLLETWVTLLDRDETRHIREYHSL